MGSKKHDKDVAVGLMQMYQAGFLDHYLFANPDGLDEDAAWDVLKDDCKKCFEARFIKNLEAGLKRVKDRKHATAKG